MLTSHQHEALLEASRVFVTELSRLDLVAPWYTVAEALRAVAAEVAVAEEAARKKAIGLT